MQHFHELQERVRNIAGKLSRQFSGAFEVDDLAQVGWLGVAEAVRQQGDLSLPLATVVAKRKMLTWVAVKKNRRYRQMDEKGGESRVQAKIEDMELSLDLREALAVLTPLEQEAILLAADFEPREAAKELGVTIATVQTRLVRARKKLRAALGGGYNYMQRKHSLKYGDGGYQNRKMWAAKAAAENEAGQAA